MKKIFIFALIFGSLFVTSCTGAQDTAKAESFFKGFLSAVKENKTDEILSAAPFLSSMNKEQQDAALMLFTSLASSDYRLTTTFAGHGTYNINVYIPGSSGNASTYTIGCEKDKNGKWTVLQKFQQTVKIDRISL